MSPHTQLRRLAASVVCLAFAGCGGSTDLSEEVDVTDAPPGATDTTPTPQPADPNTVVLPPPVPSAPSCLSLATGTFPRLLSQTLCFESGRVDQPVPALLAYDVNAPLWSDGAKKRRWMALPAGTKIKRSADGTLTLPNGVVLIKEFAMVDRRIETRVLVRRAGGVWDGATYVWNAAQTDATLSQGAPLAVGSLSWTVPTVAQCFQCHSKNAPSGLGISVMQLNRTVGTADTGVEENQLVTWSRLGLFDQAITASPSTLPRLADPYDTSADVTARARAYLHANCANCHRSGGSQYFGFDFSGGLSFAATKLCNTAPRHGDLGVAGSRLIVPGQTSQSIVSLRMHRTSSARMPRIGSAVVDEAALKAIDAWIAGLKACE